MADDLDQWAKAAERDPNLPYYDVVYDEDLGAIAQVTHPDGTVVTAADHLNPENPWAHLIHCTRAVSRVCAQPSCLCWCHFGASSGSAGKAEQQ